VNPIASRLKAFAKGRETAYRIHRKLTPEKVVSITRILQRCEYFRDAKASGWVQQIQADILLILPSEDSGLKKTRDEILNIINSTKC